MGGKSGGSSTPEPEVEYVEEESEDSSAAWETMQAYLEQQNELFTEQMNELQEENERLRQEAEENALLQEREDAYDSIELLWQSRNDAVGTAIDEVDAEIEEEQAYADTMGTDYSITDEEREERIADKFQEYWSTEYETELAGLLSDYGSPEMTEEDRLSVESGDLDYYWDPDVKYGDFSYYTGEEETEEEGDDTSSSSSSSTSTTEEDEETSVIAGDEPGVTKKTSLLGSSESLSLL